MLADVIAENWQHPVFLAWLTETNFAPVSVSVRRGAETNGLLLYRNAVYELHPVCLTDEKCLALLHVNTEQQTAIPVLWELAAIYASGREHHDALSRQCNSVVAVHKGTFWQIAQNGFVTYATAAEVKSESENIKVKTIDDETTAVKLLFCPGVHQILFDFVREQAFACLR